MDFIFAIVAAAHEQLVEQDLIDGQYNIVKCNQELIIETEVDGAALIVTVSQSHPLHQSLLNEFERVDSIDRLTQFSGMDQYRKVLSLFTSGSVETTVYEFDTNTIHVVVDHGGDPKEVSQYMLVKDKDWISIYKGSSFVNEKVIDLYVGEHNPNRHVMVDSIKLLLGVEWW